MPDWELALEPERYELDEPSRYRFETDRREFVKRLGGIVIFLTLDFDIEAQESGRSGRRAADRNLPQEIGAWLHIAENGTIRVHTGKAEVGQNIRTSLTQAVAEEMRTRPESIEMVMADTAVTPFDMGTFGSRTTPTMAPQLRKAAAAAREMLIDLASERWSVNRKSLAVADGYVRNTASNQALSFGDLTKGRSLAKTVSADTVLTPATKWKYAGHDLAKIQAREMVTGKHKFTHDIARPGMLLGRVIRPPQWNSKLVSVNAKGAEQIPGVTVVHDGDFIAVAASDSRKLVQAASAIKAEWKAEAQPGVGELFGYLKTHVAEPTGKPPEKRAAIEEALRKAHAKVEATYTVAYIAHVPLETRAAVAEWSGGNLTVWTGTQRPFGVRSELAEAFGIPEDKIRVIVPDTGSAYGGKHSGEAAIEAARIAKAAGRPVRLTWTREEEFTWAYFRPAGVIELRGAAAQDGSITAWECHNFNSGASGIESPYAIAHQSTEFHPCDSPLRQGSYRALAATANHFARESHMDDLAHAVGMEPLAFRLRNASNPRLRAVIEAAAERFGWGRPKSRSGQGFGIAAGFEKGGYVACCAEINMAPGSNSLKIARVVEAFECGAVVNPNHLKNQIEGAIIMGLGGALFEAVDFENGRMLNPRLSRYRVPRFQDVPAIESVLLDRKDLPSAGAGETPIVGIAPAIANAIFHATGRRLHSMPFNLG